jgi:hypothetical protein
MPTLLKPQRLTWEQAIQTLMITTFILKQSFHTGYLPGNEFTTFCRHILKPISTMTSTTRYVLEIKLLKLLFRLASVSPTAQKPEAAGSLVSRNLRAAWATKLNPLK